MKITRVTALFTCPNSSPRQVPRPHSAGEWCPYGFLALNLAAPSVLGLHGAARVLPYLFGGVQGALNALTDQPLAAKRAVPFRTHGEIEKWSGPTFWQDPAFITGPVIGVIGLLATPYQLMPSRHRKQPTWAIQATYLIRGFQSEIGGLKVLFHDEQVEHLSVSRIVLWNNGAQTIRQEDITVNFPLRITASEDTDILDVTLLSSNRESNELEILPDPETNYIPITFVHLDKGNGGVIQVIHTGDSSDSLQLEGELIGVDRLRKREILFISRNRRRRRLMLTVGFIASAVLIPWLLITSPTLFVDQEEASDTSLWLYLSPMVIYLFLIGLLWWPYLRGRLPQGLEAFHNDPFESEPPPPSIERRFWVFQQWFG